MIFAELIPSYVTMAKNYEKIYGVQLIDFLKNNPLKPHNLDKNYDVDLLITDAICKTYLLENGMAQGDRLSMASSVELRLPLVDYKLVETIIGLRKAHSDVSLPPKYWLKEASKHIVPDFVLSRPKRGFTPTVRHWKNELFKQYGALLVDGSLVSHGILNPSTALSFSRYTTSNIKPLLTTPFAALVLEMWCRQLGI